LRTDWKDNFQVKLFGFFQLQAVTNVILSLPFLLMAINSEEKISTAEYAGLVLVVIAVSGEALADYQLKQFKKDPANKGKVCDAGLWYYSRHPNYFFEWLVWIAFFIAALPSPHGWVSIICPLMMSYFLFKVTGIPMTEEQAVKSKGQAYIEYQRTTSMFVPWFKKA
jgi:steroid 5-alpha reductase family enzyme